MKAKIIINADDFGLCSGVNEAVFKAHTKGVLTSATLMCNMEGAQEAVEMAGELDSLGVGVHLNLLEGKPLSQDSAVRVLLDKAGDFKFSPGKLAIMSVLCRKVRRAIEIELGEQISWAISRGIAPTHLDSHKHFHCFGAIYKIVCRLAHRFKITAVRWPWEPVTVCGADWPQVGCKDRRRAFIVRNLARRCQKIDSGFIKNDLFFGLAHTGRIDDKFWAELCRTQFSGIAEVMTHPGYADRIDAGKTRLVKQRESELKWLCQESTKQNLSKAGIKLVHYGRLDRDMDE